MDCYSYPSKAVTISSRRPDGSAIGAWELEPMRAEGKTLDEVGSCEITLAEKKKAGYVVHGTTGYEHVTFYFDKAGHLVEYFFSW